MAFVRKKVSSSHLQEIGYDAETRTLEVWFSTPGQRWYAYYNVTPETWEELSDAGSPGGYLHRVIIPRHQYRDITKEKEEV